MAKGGRRQRAGGRPKPTELKVLEGTFRADRHSEAPQVAAGWPEPPAHLSPRERELWDGLARHCGAWTAPSDALVVNGVVALMDRLLRNQEAQRATEDAGHPLAYKHTMREKDGQQTTIVEAKENPLISQELKLWRELRSFVGLLGLSPADRARMPKGEAPAADPFEAFLRRGAKA